MSAQIVFDDGAPTTGSKDNGSLGTLALSNFNNTGVLGWTWSLADRPIGSAAVLSNAHAAAPQIDVDIAGTYLVQLITYTDVARTAVDDADQQVYAVRLAAPHNWRIPAAGETTQLGARGWATAVETALRDINESIDTTGASPSTSAFFDELDDCNAWTVETANGGTVKRANNLASIGFPGSGALVLQVSTAEGSSAAAQRSATGLIFDDDTPIVIGARWRMYVDNECTSFIGAFGVASDAPRLVGLIGTWDADEDTRAWLLVILDAAGDIEESAAVTLPSLGDFGTGYRLRLTISATQVQLELGVDNGALAVVATIEAAPPEVVYVPYAKIDRDTGAGDRILMIDWSSGTASRYAEETSGGETVFEELGVGDGVTDHGALSGLADNDHPQYLRVDGASVMEGDLDLDGFEVFGVQGLSCAEMTATNTATVNGSVVVTDATKRDLAIPAVKTSAYTILGTEDVILVDDTAGRVDLTAPLLTDVRGVMIQKVAGGTGGIRIIRTTTEQINGVAASYDLPGSAIAWASATPQAWFLYSDGSNRYVA